MLMYLHPPQPSATYGGWGAAQTQAGTQSLRVKEKSPGSWLWAEMVAAHVQPLNEYGNISIKIKM